MQSSARDGMELLGIRDALLSGKTIYGLSLRVAYYARVSTEKDSQQSSLENQIFYYEELIEKNENWRYAGRYVDEGLSGSSVERRENFLRMIEDAKARKFDLVITKEISRFSRSTLDSIRYTQELLRCGVGVFFQSDGINTLLPDSELRLTIMASMAQEEVRKLSERLRFGYKRSIEKGRVLGQSNILGYDKNDGVLTINPKEAAIVRRIFALYNEGKWGVRRIAKMLYDEGMVSPGTNRMFSPDTIRSVLQNPKYKGFYCSGKTISVDYRNPKRLRVEEERWNQYRDENIPALVSEMEWDKANALYRERGDKMRAHADACQARYPFSGKLICGEHGTTYHRHVYKSKAKGAQEVWNCRFYRQMGKEKGCDSPTIYTSELNGVLAEIYRPMREEREKVIAGLLALYRQAVPQESRGGDTQKSEENIRRKKEKLLELYVDGALDKAEFVERNGTYNRELEALAEKREAWRREAEAERMTEEKLREMRKIMEELLCGEDFCTVLTETLLDKIVVHKIEGDKRRLRLEIHLKAGGVTLTELPSERVLSFDDIGISQAQVSRLEKNAVHQMRKYL